MKKNPNLDPGSFYKGPTETDPRPEPPDGNSTENFERIERLLEQNLNINEQLLSEVKGIRSFLESEQDNKT